jgi:hypothetical protein
MTAKEKAESLVNEFRILLMNEDTECGNEILCTSIAKECALKSIEFAREFITGDLTEAFDKTMYLFEIKTEIEKL